MIKSLRLLITLAFISVSFLSAVAQESTINVFGTVKDELSGKKMADVTVSLEEDGQVKNTVTTGINGKFEFILDYGHEYNIRFGGAGYVTKFITIDSKNVPDEDKIIGQAIDLDMSLFQDVEGINFDILKKPIGIARYDSNAGDVSFDYKYTRSIQEEIARLRRQLEEKYKEEEERLRKEKEDAEKQRLTQEQFDKLVLEGDDQFSKSNYLNAVFKFSDALDLIPGVKYVEEKLAKAQAALEKQKKEEESNAKYTQLIASADAAFKNADYQNAVSTYEKAILLKDEQYPKDQIALAKVKLDKIAEQKALDEQYNALITRADAAYKTNSYEDALASYTKAVSLKTDQYPKDQIAKIEGVLKEKLEQEAKDLRYKELIASADKAFDAGTFDKAIGDYNQAIALKSTEQYPKDKIAAAQAKLDEAAAAQAKEEQYKSLIASADTKFKANDFTAAISDYQKASAIKSSEQYPKDQVAVAQAKLDAAAAAQAKEAEYKSLIASADAKFKGSDYTAAIADYQSALAIKGQEQYPKDKIAAAQAKLDAVAAAQVKEEQYKSLIASADSKFGAEDYAASIADYKKALGIKVDEQYPKDQVIAAQAKLDAIAAKNAKEAEYKAILATADAKLEEEEYNTAITGYNKALGLKPDEQYPKDQILKAEAGIKALEEKRKLDEQYNNLVAAADKKFTATAYEAAILDYQQALTVKDEQYPKDKIADAKAKIAEIAQAKKTDKAYNDALAYADSQMQQKAYINAITSYEGASSLKPTEQYPKDQIAKANALIKAQEDAAAKKETSSILDNTIVDVPDEQPVEKSRSSFTDITKLGKIEDIPTDTVRVAEKPKNPTPKVMYKLTPDADDESFRRLLGENYPDGLTTEKYTEGNKTIYRSIYVQEKLGDEYLKVEARFGTFYFKNGSTISATDYNAYLASMQ